MFPAAETYGIELEPDDADVERLLAVTPADASPASELTFSRNVFLPLTTACRYTCTYCTYYDVPGEAALMSPEDVRETLRLGADAGCTEALFTFGDEPDERYTAVHDQLAEWGYEDMLDYLRDCCEMAMEEGLLAHSNPGDLSEEQFERLAPINASMGVMLETTADVKAHSGGRRKTPGQRLNTLRAAGRVGVPFTTGLLIGIGETWRDRAESLLAIRELHERYDHVQEVIVQNVVPNERSDFERPSLETMRRVVAMARVALPEEVSVQVPPNLSPTRDLLDCGVDDLGGVSPVTDDYVNPDYAWPALDELRDIADGADVPLYERLPVYERYLPERHRRPGFDGVETDRSWLSDRVARAMDADDVHGERYRGVARRDGPLAVGSAD
ncbi:7,8-didemethyl-8-hydroxy-5-deazariboflavin synthase subunit CofG [Halogeometricum sp. S1BR25-6]|uniref:7,8-didemethyl-8-hydroxy-5-deazariboflavin synthase n=1 Tax=Halogeometricum salsisoli TaxID=2950536 RepID=A0ABU2GG72_9EURY|nr:7,8-didemethyl-8-hydroxy-5-deazariboflavin synthase subunit CofG [Halogeometricum sp. S1BR25-6]MDS0299806.1 7,8-didemethyl-8-hydroxy-5-deazariboflavin synthase subunit CofG [Halogeometricum sp. S1BR25-6]